MEVANSNMKLAQAVASKCDDLSWSQNKEFEFRMQHHFKLPYEDGVDVDITNCSRESLLLMWGILKEFTTEREKRQRERALEKALRRKEAAHRRKEAAQEAAQKRKREAQANAQREKKLKFIVKCSIALP